jgi:hypothetical protein
MGAPVNLFVAGGYPLPRCFSDLRILKDFGGNGNGSADSKEVSELAVRNEHSKGVRLIARVYTRVLYHMVIDCQVVFLLAAEVAIDVYD